jgi:two-component system, cell cycle sensor histidine kinase and response regulator CckA
MILSDVIMPGMNGPQLVDVVMQQRPGIRAILMSGYTDNAIVHNQITQKNHTLLNKPILPIALAGKIRNVLDTKQMEAAAMTDNKINRGS